AGATWYVDGQIGGDTNACASAPAPCKTIGEALRRAATGDTIQVAAATYKERLAIDGKALTIQGAGAGSTILDGFGPTFARMVTLGATLAARLTLSGVTVQWGTISSGDAVGKGAGIYVAPGSTLLLSDSFVGHNLNFNSAQRGGGIANDGEATLVGVTVQENQANGGGAGIFNSGTLTLTNTTVTGNGVTVADYYRPTQPNPPGGGIYSAGGVLTLDAVALRENTGAEGGGVYLGGGTASLARATVSGNAGFAGGGIYNAQATTTLTNVTVSENASVSVPTLTSTGV